MSLWILDTNHVTYLQHEHPNVVNRLASVTQEDVAITVVTAEEMIRGWLKLMNVQSERCIKAYEEFKNVLVYLETVNILDFDRKAYETYIELRKQVKIGTKDLQIAAIALSLDGTVVTCNQKDFCKVPNLKIEDWTLD
jgi:tRNA(fMet)-specific endonuclease VapC